jgi:hypothetical protein
MFQVCFLACCQRWAETGLIIVRPDTMTPAEPALCPIRPKFVWLGGAFMKTPRLVEHVRLSPIDMVFPLK